MLAKPAQLVHGYSQSFLPIFAVRLPYAPDTALQQRKQMARTIRDPKLDTRSARAKLSHRREPYWRKISGGLSIGYRSTAGTFIAQHYSRETGRRFHSIGTADDVLDGNGHTVLTFDQAQERARKWMANL